MHVVRDTICIDKDDRLFSKEDKFCYGVSEIQKENIEEKLTRHKTKNYSGRMNIYMPYEQTESSSCNLNG